MDLAPSINREPAVIVTKSYDLVLWLLPRIERFPRAYRFTVGERLTNAALDLLLGLVEAAYSRDKRAPLANASTSTNTLPHAPDARSNLRPGREVVVG
jgi:hypothetical protein